MANIRGDNRSNELLGTQLVDYILGLGGSDEIKGGRGNDVINAGAGNDDIEGGDGDDRLYGRLGHDDLEGGDGADRLYGDEGNDELDGDAGDDYLSGADGGDWLNGGFGNDYLFGGTGFDIFEFETDRGLGFGIDTVRDYRVNVDRIDLSDLGRTYGQVRARATQVDDDVVFNFGGAGRLTLLDVDLGDLDRSDFIL